MTHPHCPVRNNIHLIRYICHDVEAKIVVAAPLSLFLTLITVSQDWISHLAFLFIPLASTLFSVMGEPQLNVPTIDLSYNDLADAEEDSIVEQIAQACSEYGFFQIINHGIPSELKLCHSLINILVRHGRD